MVTTSSSTSSRPPQSASLVYLTLWQHFQKRGAETKESMVKVTTWILGFASAVLAFLIQETVTVGGAGGFGVAHPASAIILAAAGIVLCRFAVLVLRDFNTHIDDQFDAADHALRHLKTLQPLLGIDPKVGPGPYQGQRLADRLETVVNMFSFVLVLALSGGVVQLAADVANATG